MAMPRRPDPEKFCKHCGRPLKRKRFSSGLLESSRDYDRRHYCDQTCMGAGQRTLLVITCGHCGKVFRQKNAKTRYCCMTCAAHARRKCPESVIVSATGRRLARGIIARTKCEECGATSDLVVHHKDENPTNNAKANLMVLCRVCHGNLHNPKMRPLQRCVICGRQPAKNYKSAGILCDKHYRRYKTYGSPRLRKKKFGSKWVLVEYPT